MAIEKLFDITEKTLDELKSFQLSKVGNTCTATIYAGIDAVTTVGTEHFSLNSNDQANIDRLALKVKEGIELVPYHADGKDCRMFTNDEIILIQNTKDFCLTYHTTLCNKYNMWIRRCETKEEIIAIEYGVALPADLQAEFDAIIQAVKQALGMA